MDSKYNIPEDEISVAAYYVWKKHIDYSTLCWHLAEHQLYIEKNLTNAPKNMIVKRAEQIFDARPPYDILCWLIGELSLYINKKNINR